MTPRDPALFLHEMLDCARFLQQTVVERSQADYEDDRLFRSAVQRELSIIGEALYTLNKSHPETAQSIPEHEKIIAFRHILIHGYHSLDAMIVWSVLTEKLPPLILELERMIDQQA